MSPSMNTRTPLTRRVIAALLLVLLTACHSWQPTTVSPQRLISEERPSSVRVTLTNGRQLTLVNTSIRNDSIVHGDGRAYVPVSDVSTIEVRRLSVWKTIALPLGSFAGLVALGGLACVVDNGCY